MDYYQKKNGAYIEINELEKLEQRDMYHNEFHAYEIMGVEIQDIYEEEEIMWSQWILGPGQRRLS